MMVDDPRLERIGDPDDPRAYIRLADDILDRIRGGEYKPGKSLPPLDALRTQPEPLSRNTVTAAFKLLAARGIVKRFPGRGYVVTSETLQAAEQRLLAALRIVWDGIYMFSTRTDGRFEAWRMDGTRNLPAANSVEVLGKLVLEDWPRYASGQSE
jgi:DNA-binding transcriptional regulator YhcF (GntR family)